MDVDVNWSPGQIAYAGYCDSTNGKSAITGAILPSWEGQGRVVQEAWEAAARTVLEHVRRF